MLTLLKIALKQKLNQMTKIVQRKQLPTFLVLGLQRNWLTQMMQTKKNTNTHAYGTKKKGKKLIDGSDDFHSRKKRLVNLITCACLEKRIYRIMKIVRDESPRIMFDVIMGRFRLNRETTFEYD
jgi:hypothetical protein